MCVLKQRLTIEQRLGIFITESGLFSGGNSGARGPRSEVTEMKRGQGHTEESQVARTQESISRTIDFPACHGGFLWLHR